MGVEHLVQQLEELREENERLRVDATRPRSLAEVSGRLAELSTGLAAGPEGPDVAGVDDRLDDAWHLYAEAQRMRLAVIDVLNELQVACGQLERRLRLDAGPMEIDRRVVERRRDGIGPGCGVDDCDRRVPTALTHRGAVVLTTADTLDPTLRTGTGTGDGHNNNGNGHNNNGNGHNKGNGHSGFAGPATAAGL